jgi:hypothetical protein
VSDRGKDALRIPFSHPGHSFNLEREDREIKGEIFLTLNYSRGKPRWAAARVYSAPLESGKSQFLKK